MLILYVTASVAAYLSWSIHLNWHWCHFHGGCPCQC